MILHYSGTFKYSIHAFAHRHLAKVCEVAKDLIKDCEDLLYLSEPSEVLRGVDKTLAHARQYTRSEQFVTPMVAVDMETDFSSESDVLQLVEGLGHLQLGNLSLSLPPSLSLSLSLSLQLAFLH